MTSAAAVEMEARRQIAGDDAAHGVAQALAPRDAVATPGRCPAVATGGALGKALAGLRTAPVWASSRE